MQIFQRKATKVLNVHFIGCLVISFISMGIEAVEIKRLSVPRWIRNGTEESVILDCEYVYNENDLRLVVKWFFNDNLEPVYQWIPELDKRYTSSVLLDRLDLDFAVNTADAYSRFRALRIKKPSTELSGKYTCLVASLAGQDAKDQTMTVYVPENDFYISYYEMEDSTLNVSCTAHGVFPLPVLKLYSSSSITNSPKTLKEVESSVKTLANGVYDAHVYRTFSDEELMDGRINTFECSLELPGTNYMRMRKVEYLSGSPGNQIGAAQSVSSASDKALSTSSIYVILITLLQFIHRTDKRRCLM